MSDKLAFWVNAEVKRRHWSFRVTGREAGLSHATVARIANGELRGTERTCLALARAFGVPADDLLRLAGLEPSMSPEDHQIRDRPRIVYEVNRDELVLDLWRALSPEDQEIVRELMARLGPAPVIVGEEADR
jgi:transcriptional regulator with XRE-family HTH domain